MVKLSKTINCISWIVVAIILTFIMQDIRSTKEDIKELKYSQNLILMQVQEDENQINDIDKLINKYAKQFGVQPSLAHAVAEVESGKKQESVSSAGAIGIYQLLKPTAQAMGVNPYNTEDNIKGGIKYLAYLDKKFNSNEELILASYNSGEGTVRKHGGVPPYKETRDYIKKVKKEKAKIDK